MLKKFWNDPVWSKVIGGVILAAILAIGGLLAPVRTFLLTGSPVPHWMAVLLFLILGFEMVILLALVSTRTVRITPVGEVDIVEHPGAHFPLKVYRTMRNDSTDCVEVLLKDYVAKAVSLKKFVTGVLQVKLREFCPVEEGVERIPVLPGQQFKAWVGADEKFTKVQLEQLRGKIGTLVFAVNGRRVEMHL